MNNPERERSYNKDSKVSFRILRGANHRVTSMMLGSYRKCLDSDRKYDYHHTPISIVNFLDQKQRQSTKPTYQNQLSKSHYKNSEQVKQIDDAETNNYLNLNHDRRLKFKKKRKRNFLYQQQPPHKEEIVILLQKQDKDQVINKKDGTQISVQELHYQMTILQQRLKKITNH